MNWSTPARTSRKRPIRSNMLSGLIHSIGQTHARPLNPWTVDRIERVGSNWVLNDQYRAPVLVGAGGTHCRVEASDFRIHVSQFQEFLAERGIPCVEVGFPWKGHSYSLYLGEARKLSAEGVLNPLPASWLASFGSSESSKIAKSHGGFRHRDCIVGYWDIGLYGHPARASC